MAFDLIVIGGGVNGTGIARDAAMRGLKTLLLEKGDFAAGASGASSGMIHGGIRYLRYHPKVTELACIDSGRIQKIVPHLLFRIPFILPLTAEDLEHPTFAERFLAFGSRVYLKAYDLYQPFKAGKPSVELSADEVYALEPAIRKNLLGAVTLDEWGIDAVRLCTLNALSARQHGAEVQTHTRVEGFERGAGGEVLGVRFRDELTGATSQASGRLVVNVAGAWAPRVAALAGVTVKMRPGKGVHLTLDRRLSNYGIICYAVDGRQIFVMPHEDTTVIGTTDDDYYGDPDDLRVTEDEVAYLLEGAERAVPGVSGARILRAWAGIRTTLHAFGKPEDELSREHAIYDHANEGAPGLVTLIGGKLASFRIQSEEVTDLACRKLGVDRDCRTHLEPLPGGERFPDTAALARDVGLPESVVARMAYRHGSNAERICASIGADRSLGALLCECEQVTYGEVLYSMREEGVRKLVDLRRRCRIGKGPCQGTRCLERAAALYCCERGVGAAQARAELLEFANEVFRLKRPVMGGLELAQEELFRGNHLTSGSLGPEVDRG